MATSVIGSPVSFPRELLYVVAGAAVAWCAVRPLEWVWWRPRRLDRALRSQGLRGTPYRSVAGDAPLAERLNEEARSRSMPLGCHDVVHRAMPLFHQTMKEHGKMSITWFGPSPRVTITKPALVREVLSNKHGHFEKLKLGRLQRMLHNGIGSHEGEKWAKHRRIINPAFHLEKLKPWMKAERSSEGEKQRSSAALPCYINGEGAAASTGWRRAGLVRALMADRTSSRGSRVREKAGGDARRGRSAVARRNGRRRREAGLSAVRRRHGRRLVCKERSGG